MNIDEVFDYLKSLGFQTPEYLAENERYIQLDTKRGRVKFGWEYQHYSVDGWENPSTPEFYIWSGLGDHESYGFFIRTSTDPEVVLDNVDDVLKVLAPELFEDG